MRCAGPPSALWSLSLVLVAGLASGSAVNRTIDDTRGDSVTGAQVQYLPIVPASEGPLWFNQSSCAGCADVPDANLAFDNTWSAALYLADIGTMSLRMKFSGTAIYVFFIIPNFSADSGLASVVRCTFFLDGVSVGSFTHNSDGSGTFKYDTLVYKNTSIPNGDHVLLVETTGTDPAIVIFDFAIYTTGGADHDPPAAPISTSPGQTNVASPTAGAIGAPANTDTTGTGSTPDPQSPPSSISFTQTQAPPPFPTAPAPGQSSTPVSSPPPFFITPGPSGAVPSLLNSTPAPQSPAPADGTAGVEKSMPVLAIVGGVVGGVILAVLILVFLLLYRRRRKQFDTGSGTISIFNLLEDSPPLPRPRPLRTPPSMSEHNAGRSIDATPSKAPTPFMRTAASHGHSAQSSVSGYSDARSDLHIHIPMTSFNRADLAHTPLGHSPAHTPSHSHSHSHSHAHSPITRNGVPIPPDQADIVHELLLRSLRGGESASSLDYTPTTETGADDEDDEPWAPVVHVDSGIRISRAMMDLPPVYAAR